MLRENFSFKELLFLSLFFLLCLFIFYSRSGGIISWDEMYYTYLAGTLEFKAAAVNRYLHIYVLRFFMNFLEPVVAVRAYWGGVVSLVAILIYVSSKILFKNKIASVMSVLMYLSMAKIFRDNSGVPYSEFSVMFFVALHFFFYTLLYNKSIAKKTFLIITGIFCILALRCKEIGICVGFWFILSIIDLESKKITIDKKLSSNILFSILGLILGLTIMCILDGIFLNKIFFFFEPNTWKELFGFNIRSDSNLNNFNTANFFIELLHPFNYTSIPFLLFLISFGKIHNLGQNLKICWAYFFVFISFLLSFYAVSSFFIVPRYTLVAYPLLAMLASTCFLPDEKKNINGLAMLFLAFLFSFISIKISDSNNSWNGHTDYFFGYILLTFSMIIILISFLFKQNLRIYILTASVFLGTGKLYNNIFDNYSNLLVRDHSQKKFLPLEKFKNEINDYLAKNDSDIKIHCSENFYKKWRLFARNRASCQWTFAVYFSYFNHNIYSYSLSSNAPSSLRNKDIIIWSIHDYIEYMTSPENSRYIKNNYTVDIKDKMFVLLLNKHSTKQG